MEVPRLNTFTFVWMGRDESRKALGRALLALEKAQKKADMTMLIRSDWMTPQGRATATYLHHKRDMPILFKSRIIEIASGRVSIEELSNPKDKDIRNIVQMADCPHKELVVPYNMGDVYLCTSKAGGFEMGINEAMACGLPALVGDWTFMNERVVDGKNGFLIPVEEFERSKYDTIWGKVSVDALADKMVWCAENVEKVKAMGRWVREYVKESYSWEREAEKLKKEILNE